MHRSRLGGLIIDCQTENLEHAAEFWSNALGLATVRSDAPGEENYIELQTAPNELAIEVQQVAHPSRVHIDIETDDIEAEAQRLEALGATRIGPLKGWMVMESPTGQRFCLIKPTRSAFAEEANIWD